jgi:hypothetical protein
VTKRDPDRRDRLVQEVLRRARARRGAGLPAAAVRPISAKPRGHRRSDNNLAADFMESVLDQRRAGRRLAAVRTGLQCARLHPLDPHYHKALVYSIAPQRVLRRLRRTAAT